MDAATLLGIVSAIAPYVIGHPEEIDYSIREKIQEVERYVGKELPKAWEYFNTYVDETKWGNSMFFIWDKRTHWAKAKGAIINLQKYLQDVINEYEKKKKVAGIPKTTWVIPIAIGGSIIAIAGALALRR